MMRVNAKEIHPAHRSNDEVRDGLVIQLDLDDEISRMLSYDDAFGLIGQLAESIRRGQVLDRRVAAQAVTGGRG